MTTPVIIDAAVVVILVAFAIYGVHRGLLKSLAGLVIIIVALVGAGMIAATFTSPVTNLLTPLIETRIGEHVEQLMDEYQLQLPDGVEELEEIAAVEELLILLGLDEEVRAQLKGQAQESIQSTGASLASAVVAGLVRSFVYGVLFVLAFLLLLLLLHILVGAMDLVTKLPGLHGLNALGGGLFGLIEGALLLFLIVWVARRFGVSFETEALAEAHILRTFTSNTPLSVLSFLQ